MKNTIIITVICLLVIFGLYNSVYFEKLDTKKGKKSIMTFDPKDKVKHFWDNKLDEVLATAIDINVFDSQFADNPESLIGQRGKSIGITSTYAFLVKGLTKQAPQDSDAIHIEISDGIAEYNLQTKYIFGNAARDATGYFNIDDFENTMDFNAVAAELNKLIQEQVITKLDSFAPGETLKFFGALEMNSENIPRQIGVIPLKIEAVR